VSGAEKANDIARCNHPYGQQSVFTGQNWQQPRAGGEPIQDNVTWMIGMSVE
jgi:hypothetical protein